MSHKPVLLIVGPPETGKTRLANWMASALPEQSVLRLSGRAPINTKGFFGLNEYTRLVVVDDVSPFSSISDLIRMLTGPEVIAHRQGKNNVVITPPKVIITAIEPPVLESSLWKWCEIVHLPGPIFAKEGPKSEQLGWEGGEG